MRVRLQSRRSPTISTCQSAQLVPVMQVFSYFRTFFAPLRSSEGASTLRLHPERHPRVTALQIFTKAGGESAAKLVEVDLLAVSADGGDDVQGQRQRAAAFLHADHRLAPLANRLQE